MAGVAELQSRLRAIISDRESGSSEIALRILRLLSEEPEFKSYQSTEAAKLLDILIKTALERPSMVLPANLLSVIREALLRSPCLAITRLSSRLLEIYSESLSTAVSNAVKRISGFNRVFTLSYSSQVLRTITSLRDVSVYLTVGWPLFDGLRAAEKLRDSGVSVHVYPDAALAEAVHLSEAVVVGCDAVLRDGSLVNRSGTLLAALAAEGERPVIGIVDSFKLDRLNAWRPETTTHRQGGFELSYTLFETTPPRLLSEFISEIGALKPLAFTHEAEKRIGMIVEKLVE
jgi:translation initiation factor eIF-2B subunit delta